MRRPCALAGAAVATLVLAAVAAAGPPGRWTPLSKGVLDAADALGAVRTPDGVLHIAWERRGTTVSALWRTRVGADGTAAGMDVVAGALVSAGSPALTAAPDGTVRAFFFARSADGTGSDLKLASQPPAGAWTVGGQPLAQVVGTDVPVVAAASAHDGTPLVAWSNGPQIRYRFGVDPGAAGVTLNAGGCCASAVRPAVDQVTGRAYLAWASSVHGANGVYVQAVDRRGATGVKVFATGSATKKRNAAVLPDGRVALAARLGQTGVYLAYTAGFPKVRLVNVLRAGARKLVFSVKAPGAAHVALVPSVQGRLWLAWSQGGSIFAARTNRDATRLGAVREIPLRKGAASVAQLETDGTLGSLDLVASLVSGGGAVAIWHEQVLPGLTLAVTATTVENGPTRYAFRVTDAGEPVANASVKVGKQSLTTGVSGAVTLSTGDHPPTATASKLGYAPATVAIP